MHAPQLGFNAFTGALPASWAKTQLVNLILESNQLSGSAFPPAWLEPRSFPHLQWLSLSNNHGLTGTLPPNLAWPSLVNL